MEYLKILFVFSWASCVLITANPVRSERNLYLSSFHQELEQTIEQALRRIEMSIAKVLEMSNEFERYQNMQASLATDMTSRTEYLNDLMDDFVSEEPSGESSYEFNSLDDINDSFWPSWESQESEESQRRGQGRHATLGQRIARSRIPSEE